MNRHATVTQPMIDTAQYKSSIQVYGHQPEMLRYLTEQCNFAPYSLLAFDDTALINNGEPISLYLDEARVTQGMPSIIESQMRLFFWYSQSVY
ncbi:hypothetical protein AB6D11_02565 [Vibrio splendidus]